MRQVVLFLLCGVALAAGAAEIWRWTDANGVVHYSDQPRPGAERVTVNVARPSGSGEPPPPPPEVQPRERPAQPFTYTTCAVSSPANDEVFQGVQAIPVELTIEPDLQLGHRIQVLVNGTPRPDWPEAATSYTFAEVFRGSYRLEVRILDANARLVCTGPATTFHLRQPSVLSPTSPLAPRPPTPPTGG